MRSSKRLLLPSLLALALAACGGEKPAATPALPAGLATFKVEAGQGLPGRGWDGVVEAVRRADLAAQTAGRVQAVLVARRTDSRSRRFMVSPELRVRSHFSRGRVRSG